MNNTTFQFNLTRNGKEYGTIRWTAGNDAITGDHDAVAALEEAIEKAIAARHSGYPMPGTITIEQRPQSVCEMILILEFGGFDMPECFVNMTSAADLKRMEERERDRLRTKAEMGFDYTIYY